MLLLPCGVVSDIRGGGPETLATETAGQGAFGAQDSSAAFEQTDDDVDELGQIRNKGLDRVKHGWYPLKV